MPVERINPPDVYRSPAYSHLVAVSDCKLLYLAGQVALDEEGNVVGKDDLNAQAVQALKNIERILAAAGAGFEDIVKFTFYIVDYRLEKRQALIDALMPYLSQDALPGSTLLGVQALAHPDLLIEIDVVAAIENK